MKNVIPLALLRKRAREKRDRERKVIQSRVPVEDPTLNPEAGQYRKERDNY